MQKAANTSRFLIDFSLQQRFADSESFVSRDGSLQDMVLSQLAHSANSHQIFTQVANRFTRLAEHFYSMRDVERLGEASRVLMNLPLAGARQIGLYYHALTLKRAGQLDEAQSLFESIADNGPSACRARAFHSLGALFYDKGEPAEALRFYLEAARATAGETRHYSLVTLLVQLEISHIKAHIGDHDRALSNLETLAPLVRLVAKQHPLYFSFYHNALAVELGELGRVAEAEAVCAIALASPFAAAYPEYAETRDQIAAKRASATQAVVAVNRTPEPRRSPQVESQSEPAPSRLHCFDWSAHDQDSFQRALVPIPKATTTLNAMSILEQVLICIGPRAPPALS